MSVGERHGPEPRAPGDARPAIHVLLDYDRLQRRLQSIVADAFCDDAVALREEWGAFETEVLRHLDVEDLHILPAFAREMPIEARLLLEEHDQIRTKLAEIGVDLELHCLPQERLGALVDALRAHAHHEHDVLHPWADHSLDEIMRERLQRMLSRSDAQEPPAVAAPGEWQIDAARSRLSFSLRHIVIHTIRGQFASWGGSVLTSDGFAGASARLWIGLGSVDTGDAERDAQLRSREFFDVDRFPQARFTSTEIGRTESGPLVCKGRLDLHGILGEVEVEITGQTQWTDDRGVVRISCDAKARLNRRDFDLRWNQDLDVGGVVVGDEVEILAHVEAVRNQPRGGDAPKH